MRESWHKQSGESPKAYAAFAIYRDLGSQRSLEDVSQQLHKSKTLLARWSTRDNWVVRADAFDNHQANLMAAANEEQVKLHAQMLADRQAHIRERALEMHDRLLDKAEKMLDWPLATTTTADGKTIVKPSHWTLNDAARMIETADKIGRLAAELPTDIVGAIPELTALMTELNRAGVDFQTTLRRMVEKAREANNARR